MTIPSFTDFISGYGGTIAWICAGVIIASIAIGLYDMWKEIKKQIDKIL